MRSTIPAGQRSAIVRKTRFRQATDTTGDSIPSRPSEQFRRTITGQNGRGLETMPARYHLPKFLLFAVGIVAQSAASDRMVQGTPENPWWAERHQRSAGIKKLRRLQAEAEGLLGEIASMPWKAAAQDQRRRHTTSSCPVALDGDSRARYNQSAESRHQ